MVTVFNKDSRYMSEVNESSIDAVVTSPPFNIGHTYDGYDDDMPFLEYAQMLNLTIQNIRRVLKPNGILIIDIADVIIMKNDIIHGATFLYDICLKNKLFFKGAKPYLIKENHINKETHTNHLSFERNNTDIQGHSSCEILLFFSCNNDCDIRMDHFKSEYDYSKVVNSAYWPESLISDLLEVIEPIGKTILDPYMGSGSIGYEIDQLGGSFIGYEINNSITNL